MNNSISSLAISLMIGVGVFLGMFTFMSDMVHYNVTLPSGSETIVNQLNRDMDNVSLELQESLTGEQSWVLTSLNIFFKLPNTVLNALSAVVNIGGKLATMSVGAEAPVPIPGWIPNMMLVIIAIIVGFGLLYLVFGRDA